MMMITMFHSVSKILAKASKKSMFSLLSLPKICYRKKKNLEFPLKFFLSNEYVFFIRTYLKSKVICRVMC